MKSKVLNKRALLCSVLLFILTTPYFFWSFTQNRFFSIAILCLLLFAFINNNRKRLEKGELRLIVFYLFTTGWYLLMSLVHGMNMNGLFFSLPLFLLGFICLGKDELKIKAYDYFFTIYCVVILLSIISLILVRLGIMPSRGIINHPYAERSYYLYPFLLVENSFTNAIRFNGPYDEPGVVGTIGALFLCINGFRLKEWRNVVVLFSGLLSLSLFFYTLCAIYWLLYTLFIKKQIARTGLIIAVFAGFFILTRSNDILYERMWHRMEINEEGTGIVGDNRMNSSTEAYFNSKIGTSEFYFGVSNREQLKNNLETSSSYKVVILYHGIIFFVLYCLFFVFLAYYYRANKFSFVLFLVVFFLTAYQRTNIYASVYMFLYSILAKQQLLLNQTTNYS